MNDLQVVQVPTDSLVPYARNARKHSAKQVQMLARSIEKYGFNQPILVDGGRGVVAGHGRLAAAILLNLTAVPVIEISHLTDEQKREYIIADNKIADMARWDDQLLALEVGDLSALGATFEATGLADHELQRFLRPEFQNADETVPELAEAVVSRPGDVWILEGHRLACGDCTSASVVAACLGEARPHLMVTDPPYGVDYDPAWRAGAGLANGAKIATGKVLNDKRADWREAWALFPGAVAYVWHGGLHGVTVEASLEACGFKIRAQIVWVKQRPAISRGAYHWQHEPAYYAVQDGADDHWRFEDDHEQLSYGVRENAKAFWSGGRRQSTVWQIDHLKNDSGHGTQKPLECMRRPILNNSRAGDAVYEPFSGSGTTLIAATQTDRRCFAIELDPRYVDLAVKRWQIVTGAAARRESDGALFSDLEPA